MISALSVFGLMIKSRTVDLNLTGGEVTLEVGHIVHCIPQTELYIWENRKITGFIALIGKGEFADFTCLTDRNKRGKLCGQFIFGSFKYGITHTVTAAVSIQFCFGRHPARIPDRVTIFNIVVMSIGIERYIIIAVSGQAE